MESHLDYQKRTCPAFVHPKALAEILPAVMAKLGVKLIPSIESGEADRT
jgi:hypothetical protein